MSCKKNDVILSQEEKSECEKTMKILDKKMRGNVPLYKVQCVHVSEPKWATSKQIKDKDLIIEYENKESERSKSVENINTLDDELKNEHNGRVLRRRKSENFVPEQKENKKGRKRKNLEVTNGRFFKFNKLLPSILDSTEFCPIKVPIRRRRSRKVQSSIKKSKNEEHFVEESYAVEKIVDHKMFGDIKKYKVRWENYGPEDDSWLTVDDFDDINFVLKYEEDCEKKIKQENLSKNDFIKSILYKSIKGYNYRKEDIHGIICQMMDDEKNLCYLVQLSNGELICIYPEDIPKEMYDETFKSSQYKLVEEDESCY
uniref:Chromo domain-containing protein n=1 Tax=Parastrongyloides trichosuri TaxID=131310 RepID=A0A0N4Z820_PARTI